MYGNVTVPLADIKKGQPFRFGSLFYLKSDEIDGVARAINLSNGNLSLYSLELLVVPLETVGEIFFRATLPSPDGKA
jgi:hypothetical protein